VIPTIEHIISKIQKNKDNLKITVYPKASVEEIYSFEQTMNIKLPDDIKTFYKFCNGFESNEDLFRIIPLNEIIDNTKTDKENYLEKKGDFHIAEYMIYCDMWSLTVDEATNEYSIYNKTTTIVTLTNNFSEFLDRFLNEGVFEGLYNWREELEK
jgi:hypothetical protein